MSYLIGMLILLSACADHPPANDKKVEPETIIEEELKIYSIHCSDSLCTGSYEGPEFVGVDDIAHQLSNAVSAAVGDELKRLYRAGKYVRVNFDGIRMRTDGMGSGAVHYTLHIPFERVSTACEAYTSFDHSGGWGHPPELAVRKTQLKSALMKGEKLAISKMLSTPEGLQEYWIQWRNKDVQAACGAD